MKTATKAVKPRTVQQWIELRRLELRRIKRDKGKETAPAKAKLFLVPERSRVGQQMEFQFEETSELENETRSNRHPVRIGFAG